MAHRTRGRQAAPPRRIPHEERTDPEWTRSQCGLETTPQRNVGYCPPTLSIRVALHHTTRYSYDRVVSPSPHVVHLRPAPHCRTPILAYSLRVQPETHFLNWQQDPFGNYEARLVFQKPATELVFEVDLVADMTVINPFDFFLEKDAEHFPFVYPPALRRDLDPYLRTGAFGPRFAEFVEAARSKAGSGRRMVDVLVDLNRFVQQTIRYDIRMEPGVFAPEETLTRGHGSCRDFAWLLVQVLRQLGLAARFVSGYSIQLRADEKPLARPGRGRARLRPISTPGPRSSCPARAGSGSTRRAGCFAGEGHIPLACTPDPETAAAVTGSFSGARRRRTTRSSRSSPSRCPSSGSTRRRASPRRTPKRRGARSSRWAAPSTRRSRPGDVRLTMGGEPTFVADDDREAPEWNIDALGPTKRRYATDLLRRLYDALRARTA